MINLLSQGRGILIHGCGIDDSGEGILFAGNSGAGKSTIARLLTNKGVKVLNDDRVIIRKKFGSFWMYGTPWHGEVKECLPEKVPLKKIFFIKHSKNNFIRKITPMEVGYRLVVSSLSPFWDKRGMEFTLNLCSELANAISSYELAFVPDPSILDFIRRKNELSSK